MKLVKRFVALMIAFVAILSTGCVPMYVGQLAANSLGSGSVRFTDVSYEEAADGSIVVRGLATYTPASVGGKQFLDLTDPTMMPYGIKLELLDEDGKKVHEVPYTRLELEQDGVKVTALPAGKALPFVIATTISPNIGELVVSANVPRVQTTHDE